MSTQINESDLVNYTKAMQVKYAAQFPELRDLTASASIDGVRVMLHGYIDDTWNSAFGHGITFEEAAADLRAKLGTKESKAKELREKAERLIAEAAALEA